MNFLEKTTMVVLLLAVVLCVILFQKIKTYNKYIETGDQYIEDMVNYGNQLNNLIDLNG